MSDLMRMKSTEKKRKNSCSGRTKAAVECRLGRPIKPGMSAFELYRMRESWQVSSQTVAQEKMGGRDQDKARRMGSLVLL